VDFGQAASDFELEPTVVREMITELEAWLYQDEAEAEFTDDRADSSLGSPGRSFPLDGTRRLGSDVQDHAVDAW
jgi:hypothetical protein